MDLQTICIYKLYGTAYAGKVKSTFAFFDEIFHFPPAAIELDDLIWFHFHRCDNKGIHVDQLTIGFLDLEHDSAGMAP